MHTMIKRTTTYVHCLDYKMVVRMCENKYTITFNFLQNFRTIFNGWCFNKTWTIPKWQIFSQIEDINKSDTIEPMYCKILKFTFPTSWFTNYIRILFKLFCSKFISPTLFSWATFIFEEIFQDDANVTIIPQNVSHPSHQIFTKFKIFI